MSPDNIGDEMSRLYYPPERVGRGANAGPAETTPKEAGEKVAKIVPAEIITGYLGLISLCQILKPQEGRVFASGPLSRFAWHLHLFIST